MTQDYLPATINE